ncbi:hypothetical protein ACTXT7_010521 [Hymenolepis weldensis]
MSHTPIPSEIYETTSEQWRNSGPNPSNQSSTPANIYLIPQAINKDRMSGSSKIRRIEPSNSPSGNSPNEIKNGDGSIPTENQVPGGEGFPSVPQSPLGDSASQDASSQKMYWNAVNSTAVSVLE